jgi:HK97 family phage major capsid protein
MTRREELEAKQAELRGKIGQLFKDKPALDFTTEERATIENGNKELATISTEIEGIKAMEAMRDQYLNDATGLPGVGGGLPLPGSGQPGAGGGTKTTDSQIADAAAAYAKADFERRMIGAGGGLENPVLSERIAKSFIESASFKQFNKASTKPEKAPESEIQTKALLDTTGFVPAATRSNLLISLPLRRLVVADLFPQGTITQRAFVYMEETSETNAAAAVAEGGTKPESALAFAERTANVRKIATVLPVTDELFDDAPAMQAYLQGRLTVFLQMAEENALLNGSGVAPNIQGVLNNPGILTQARATDTAPDAFYKAATKVATTSFLDVSAFVMHPVDWQNIRLLKDTTNQYLFGSPLNGDIERLFGYPVVKTPAIAQGTGLAGAFDLGGFIFRRTGIMFAVSTEHADFFIKNQLMLRVEERLAFPVFRPSAFCTVTGLP